MKKFKIMSLVACIVMSFSFVGCDGSSETSKEGNENVSEVTEISSDKKEKISKKVYERLSDKNITNVDILTDSATGKAMINIQVQGDILKDDINKSELESLCDDIKNKINDLSNKISIEFIDKNFQLIDIFMFEE